MKRGVYIHIPFCTKKCPYCDFYSIPYSTDTAEAYFNALIYAIKSYKQSSISVDSVYFGGGTPNLFGEHKISELIKELRSNFNIDENCEITMEANPEALCKQDIGGFKNAGINRLSLGLQSSNPSELFFLGRTHTPEQVKYCVENAKKVGINNISLDLMLALENQNLQDIESSVNFCKELDIEHISCYLLKVESGTLFFKNRSSLSLPDDEKSAEIYLNTCNLIEKAGYRQYEISNFSKDGYKSRHNLKYWNCEEYVGIGASAHGFLNGKRYYYTKSVRDFINNPVKTVFDCNGGDAEEEFMLKLRLCGGIDIEAFESRHHITFSEKLYEKLFYLYNAGYVNFFETGNISLTQKGFIVSNTIISELLDCM